MEIWKKWSMTAMLSKPASSAVLATAASLLPSCSAEPAPLNSGTCKPIFTIITSQGRRAIAGVTGSSLSQDLGLTGILCKS